MFDQLNTHPRRTRGSPRPAVSSDLLRLKLALLPLIFAIMACGGTPPAPVDSHTITVLGLRTVMQPGSAVELPILISNSTSHSASPNSPVKVSLGQTPERATELFSGRTDKDGFVTAKFAVPKDVSGPNQYLIITTDKLFGSGAFSRAVYLGPTSNVLISTDKPIYQPGQTLHARVLVLDSLMLKPAAGQALQLRLQNGDGIFLLNQQLTLDEWGIAHLDYELDTRALSGNYQLIANIGPTEAQRTVEIKPYTLPRFSVLIHPGKPYYGVDETITGTVQAHYFFGKPVAQAAVQLRGTPANSDDVILTLDGQTDQNGAFAFEAKVPLYFFDRVNQGTDTLRWVAVVTDTASHAEQTSDDLVITAEPFLIEAVPESGFLRPSLNNLVYLQVSWPDGTPAPAKLQIDTGDGQPQRALDTDGFGLATVNITPLVTNTLAADRPITITAQINDVAHTQVVKLGNIGTRTSLLVRPAQVKYNAGQPIQLDYFVNGSAKTLYLDIAKNGQTIDMRAIDLSPSASASVTGTHTFNIDPALLGTLEINAYTLGANGDIASDQRLVLIEAPPADMTLKLDAEQYAPGGTAKLNIDVNKAGQGQPSALGISIVDESVFAIGAQDPAFVRTYFLLQQELLKRRYGLTGYAPFAASAPTHQLEHAAQVALNGAIAQSQISQSPNLQSPISKSPSSPVLIAGWSGRALFTLPLIGLIFYDHRRRRNRIMLGTLIGIAILGGVLMGCAAPAAAPAAPAGNRADAPSPQSAPDAAAAPKAENAAPRLRQFFPETLMWLPNLITDANGHAQVDVPLADSITTWRVSVVASGKDGTLGSASTNLRVFQDFFIEPTVPKQLTQNDEVEIPVAIYNYLQEPQTVEISVAAADWMTLAAEKQTQQITLNPGDVTSVKLPIKVGKPGQHALSVTAKGARMSDAIQKPVTVLPDGRKVQESRAGVLARSADASIELPKDYLPGTDRLSVSVAPANSSALALGLPDSYSDSSCFYSDIGAIHPLAVQVQYLKAKQQLTPEQQIRTEKLLYFGVQRLMRYYDPKSGGFSGDCHLLFRGQPNAAATATALMALTDIQKVIYVDPALIAKASLYIADTQNANGTWAQPQDSGYFYFCGAPSAMGNEAEITLVVASALAEVGQAKGQAAQRALAYLRERGDQLRDAHSQALFANALLLADPNDGLARRMLDAMLKGTSLNNGERLWLQDRYTYLDTTAIAALVLLRSGRYADEAQEALAGLRSHFGSENYYLADPARVNLLRALLLDADLHPSVGNAEIALQLNGRALGAFSITPENAALTQQKDWGESLQAGANTLQLQLRGNIPVRFAMHAEYYVPRGQQEAESLDLRSNYGTQQTTINGAIEVNATVFNHAAVRSGPVMVELGVPTGFWVRSSDLDAAQQAGKIGSVTVLDDRIVISINDLLPEQEIGLRYQIMAMYPGRVRAPSSTIYPAVATSNVTTVTPDVTLLVTQ